MTPQKTETEINDTNNYTPPKGEYQEAFAKAKDLLDLIADRRDKRFMWGCDDRYADNWICWKCGEPMGCDIWEGVPEEQCPYCGAYEPVKATVCEGCGAIIQSTIDTFALCDECKELAVSLFNAVFPKEHPDMRNYIMESIDNGEI